METTTQTYDEFLLELDKYRNKTIYARITALTFEESPIESIEGRVTQGSINLDGASALRRSCSLTIVAQDFFYDDYLWGLNTKFKLEIGVENPIDPRYPSIIWFKQGIYLISSFNTSRSANNFSISIQGKDKMCLLNGEVGGSLTSSVDFGTIEEEDENGNWVINKIPIPEIIKNLVHTYANEPYHNIIINDLNTYGLELLEYRYGTPMYLYRKEGAEFYDGVLLENGDKRYYLEDGGNTAISLVEIPSAHLDLLVESLVGVEDPLPVYIKNSDEKYEAYYFAKVEYGQTAGYRQTDLVYAGDLIANVGESITSVLDKIKNMLAEFEYFYNLEGQFVFQKKQSFISTMWGPSALLLSSYISDLEHAIEILEPNMTDEEYNEFAHQSEIIWGKYDSKLRIDIMEFSDFKKMSYAEQQEYLEGLLAGYEELQYASDMSNQPIEQLATASSYSYVFNGGELITAFNNNPQLLNLRNDFSVWGERTTISGAKVPVHFRYAIDEKPTYYKAFDGKIYVTSVNEAPDVAPLSLNVVDWREIIFQMAKDYYKHNTEDTFEMNVAANNAPRYRNGRTGYESYYIDIQGFWRQLYDPGLIDSCNDLGIEDSDGNIIGGELFDLECDINELDILIYGKKITTSDTRQGGYENDIIELNNTLNNKTYKEATDLVKEWNAENADKKDFHGRHNIYTIDEKTKKKKDVTDPALYLSLLQDLSFRSKSELATLQINYDKKKTKYDSLTTDRDKNYYMDVPDSDIRKYWNKSVYESPSQLNFWFDFLEAKEDSELGRYSVKNIGARTKSINDTNIKSIYFRETPGVIFVEDMEKAPGGTTGYKYIQVQNIDTMFTISAQGKSAKEKLDELLYQHSYCVQSATITTIPIYYLQPNTRVYLYDEETRLKGDYIISKITIPLAYNGTMQLTATKAAENII